METEQVGDAERRLVKAIVVLDRATGRLLEWLGSQSPEVRAEVWADARARGGAGPTFEEGEPEQMAVLTCLSVWRAAVADVWFSIAKRIVWFPEKGLARVQCRPEPGTCFGCCRGPVALDVADAARLIDALPYSQINRATYRGALMLKAKDPEAFWCPVLGSDGRCTVYDARPMVCRVHAALTPASTCAKPGTMVASPGDTIMADLMESSELIGMMTVADAMQQLGEAFADKPAE